MRLTLPDRFVEVGMLPPPVASLASNTIHDQPNDDTAAGNSGPRPDVPHLANLAVSPQCRRLGVATKLIKVRFADDVESFG